MSFDAAGRWRRHRDNVVAAIICRAPAFARIGLIVLEIVGCHDAGPPLLRQRRACRRSGPLIECRRAFMRNCPERVREIALNEPIAGGKARRHRALERFLPMMASRASRRIVRRQHESAVSSPGGNASRAHRDRRRDQSASLKWPEPYFSSATGKHQATVPGTADGERGNPAIFADRALPYAIGGSYLAPIAFGAVSR